MARLHAMISRSRLPRLALLGAGVVAALGATTLTLDSTMAASDSQGVPGNKLPHVQLSAADGYQSISHMTQIISGRSPLWMFKDGSGPYSETGMGFVGSLQQGFVLTAAIGRFGHLNAGLQLPLPLAFASVHPGPAEVFDVVWAFSNPAAPSKLLHDPEFMNSTVMGMHAIRAFSIRGGLAWSIDSAANGGMQEYRFAWVRNDLLTEVNIVGYRLSAAEARAVALRAGG